MSYKDVPTPDLRIVPTASLHPHEEHDSQRSAPLIERIRTSEYMINPPLVAPIDSDGYVILDGANRAYCFGALGFPHILVQVATYDSGLVELDNWQHVISGWDSADFIRHLNDLPQTQVAEGHHDNAIAHFVLRDGRTLALLSPVTTTHERNAALRRAVAIYQRNAALHRTTLTDPDEIWQMYPEAIGFVVFPRYTPDDIIAAASEQAYLPPGISRHIVHGRAIQVNYPLEMLRDPNLSLEQKNLHLLDWMREKLARRQIRYYAEATYQFDE